MTNKEAIEIIKDIILRVPTGLIEPSDFYDALDLAIKALEQTVVKENLTSGDLVSRSALKKVISEYIEEYSDVDNNGNHSAKWCAMKEAEMAIDNAPTVVKETLTTERPTGKWIMNKTSRLGRNYTCTHCKGIARNKFVFCPNCGADMRGGRDERIHGNDNM